MEGQIQDNFWRRHMTAIDIIAGIIIIILVMAAVFFQLRYAQLNNEFERFQNSITLSTQDTQILQFADLFIDKVLKAQGEIDFETRLNLESAVRGLNDNEILAAWEAFTNAPTENAAQTAVKNLLSLLVKKSLE